MLCYVGVLVEKLHGLVQLVLAVQAHKSVDARVGVRYEHESDARDRVGLDQIILPGASKAVRDQVAEKAEHARETRVQNAVVGADFLRDEISRRSVYVTEEKDANSDQTHAQVLVSLVGLVRDELGRDHDKETLARLG